MKVPISDYALIDLGAPVLPAYEAVIEGVTHWVVWCKFCNKWHWHEACSRSSRRLDAVLITELGKPNGDICGIITAFDIPKLHEALWMSPERKLVGKSV
jgi:hypothetical protein